MSKRLRPDYMRVIGKTYTLDYCPTEDMEDALGICTMAHQKIEIDETQTAAEELDTFIHETLHALVRGMRVDFRSVEAEEAVVDRLGAGLAAIFTDNPHVVRYIARLVKEANDA